MDKRVLQDIRARLQSAFGNRLHGVVLYGSTARGEATPDSDIDVLVLLAGPIRLWHDLQTSVRALYPLTLSLGRPFSPKPVDAEHYRRGSCPLYQTAQREGIDL